MTMVVMVIRGSNLFVHILLVTFAVLCVSSSAVTLENIAINSQNVSVTVDGVDVDSSDTSKLFDDLESTFLEINNSEPLQSVKIDVLLHDPLIDNIRIKSQLDGPTVYNVTLHTKDSKRWVHRIGTVCNDHYRRLANNEYTQCLGHQDNLMLRLDSSYVSANDTIRWWTKFTNIEISYAGGMNSIVIFDISVYGSYPSPSLCNCFLPGVVNQSRPCDDNLKCVCRDGIQSVDCTVCAAATKPSIYPDYGPIQGGQLISIVNRNCWSFSSMDGIYIGEKLCEFKSNLIPSNLKNIFANGTRIEGPVPPYFTQNYSIGHIGNRVPVKICWESFCLTLDGVTYLLKADPIFTKISRKKVTLSGSVEVKLEGDHLNMAPNPTLMVHLSDNNVKFFMLPSSVDLENESKRVCQVTPDEKSLTCFAPNMNIVNINRNSQSFVSYYVPYPTKGAYDGQIIDQTLMKFDICDDPKIITWNPEIQDIDKRSMKIDGAGFALCNSPSDYQVLVSNIPAEINVINNLITFIPPPKPPPSRDVDKASVVELLIGAKVVPIGYIQYDPPPPKGPIIGGVLGSVGGILAIVIVASVVYCAKKKKCCFKERIRHQKFNDLKRNLLDDLEEPLRSKVKRCLVDASKVDKREEIGKGFFGKVFYGRYNEQPVAIKSLHGEAQYNVQKKINFLEEAVMMMDFSHPNVLTLLAITIEQNTPNVILPYMKNGDLRSFVLKESNHFVLGELLNFCLQVASGMEYLASKKFVHRDLAARNCMVDENLTVKVADFGLARDLYETNYYVAENRALPLPYKWMPIECLGGKLQFSEKTDVWSFGVLMWEVFTRGCSPYFDMKHRELKTFLFNGGRLDKPSIVPDYIYDLMCGCWHIDSKNRPPFSELKSSIEAIFSSSQSPGMKETEKKVTSDIPPNNRPSLLPTDLDNYIANGPDKPLDNSTSINLE